MRGFSKVTLSKPYDCSLSRAASQNRDSVPE
jgi:hypothetical protein